VWCITNPHVALTVTSAQLTHVFAVKIVCLSVCPTVCLSYADIAYSCAFYQALTLHRFIKRTPYLIAHKFSNGKFAKTHDEEMKRWRVHFQEVL